METDPDDSERVFVAAYRHFADDLISFGYGRVAAFIRDELGDGALLGVRTGYGGTGQPWIVPAMAFDLLSGAAHLDCTCLLYTSCRGPGRWHADADACLLYTS